MELASLHFELEGYTTLYHFDEDLSILISFLFLLGQLALLKIKDSVRRRNQNPERVSANTAAHEHRG